MISASSISPHLPQVIDDSWLSQERGIVKTQPVGSTSLREAYVQYIKLYEILGQVLNRVEKWYTSPVETKTEIQGLLELDTTLSDWKKNLPPKLQHHPDVHASGGSAPVHESQQLDLKFSHQASRLYARQVRRHIKREGADKAIGIYIPVYCC
jgi:hypothetical protein